MRKIPIILDGVKYDMYVHHTKECPFCHINFSSRYKNVCCSLVSKDYIKYSKFIDKFNVKERLDLYDQIENYAQDIVDMWNAAPVGLCSTAKLDNANEIWKEYYKYIYDNHIVEEMKDEWYAREKVILHLGNYDFTYLLMSCAKYTIPHFWLNKINTNEYIIIEFDSLNQINPMDIDYFRSDAEREKWFIEGKFIMLNEQEMSDLKKIIETNLEFKEELAKMHSAYNSSWFRK